MKGSTKRSTRTPKRSQTAAERIYACYVRDLRLLLMHSAEREAKLAGMLQVVIDERFFRPVVTGERTARQPLGPEIDSDVTTFDEKADGEAIVSQEQAYTEYHKLFREQFGEKAPSERQQEELQNA